jgi:hydrogenase small subunit
LRLEWLRAGGQAQSDRRYADLQAGQQTGHQRAGLPAHRRRHDGRGNTPARTRAVPELDDQGRPKEFYGRRVHDTCYRRANYDAGLFVEAWDDEGARKGYCLYKMGCKGPVTYNACSVVKWNEGTSYPIQSGHNCIGCSEAGFWDNGPFYQHLASFPGFGVESTADTIGTAVGVATLAGVAAHAIVTNIRKRSVIAEVHTEDEKEK